MDDPMDVDPQDPSSMNYRQLQAACKEAGLPGRGKTEELRKNLVDFAKDPQETLERLRCEKKQQKKKNKDNGWIDWVNSAAREILLEDLEQNGWLYGEDLDAKVVYDIYKTKQEEFEYVVFDQFEVRYNEAIKRAAKRRARSAQEEEWLERDRLLYPRKSHNQRGEPVFDMDTEAKEQLQEDVANQVYRQMEPMVLWQFRAVYRKYSLHIFRPRIYQEIRRIKFINYLEKKRTEKRKKFASQKVSYVRKTKTKK
jgi:hypothetical protein